MLTSPPLERDLEGVFTPHYGLKGEFRVGGLEDPIVTLTTAAGIKVDPGAPPEDFSYYAHRPPRLKTTRWPAWPAGYEHNEATEMYSKLSTQVEDFINSYTQDPDGVGAKDLGRGQPRYYQVSSLKPPQAKGMVHYGQAGMWTALRAQSVAYRQEGLPQSTKAAIKSRLIATTEQCRPLLEQKDLVPRDGIIQEILDNITEEDIPKLKLKVWHSRLMQVTRAFLQAGHNQRNTSFKDWTRQHIDTSPKALYRYTNKDNLPLPAVEEIRLEGGILASNRDMMSHRVQTWTQYWGVREAGHWQEKRWRN